MPFAVHVISIPGASAVSGHVTATPRSSVTRRLVSVSLPVLVTRYVHSIGSPIGTDTPGATSASLPLVAFSIRTPGAGGTRLTILHVAIDSCVTVALNPFGIAVIGSGTSPALSGVRTTHDVSAGSLTNPGGTP